MQLPELLDVAYRLFPPFIGLVPWKYKAPASALYHSLSVAAIAGGVTELLTDDQDEIDLATYGGLAHDFYQKGSSVGLDAKSGEEILRYVLETTGVDKKVVDRVVNEATRYNIAENPAIWTHKHPVAGLSIWLADTIAGATSALSVEESVRGRATRLGDAQLKLRESLHISVVLVALPQVALRSKIYSLVVRDLADEHRAVPIVARDGLIVVSSERLGDLSLEIDELRAESQELESIRNASGTRETTFNERYKPALFTKGSSSRLVLDKLIVQFIHNLSLVGVEWRDSSRYRCLFCGLPTDEPIHPASIGYTLYGSSSMERWSPKVPAVGTNLNRLMQSGWLKSGVVACPLCVIDAIEVWKLMNENRVTSADYFVQMYFPLPTHYELARLLSSISYNVLPLQLKSAQRVVVEDIEESCENPEFYAKQALELTETAENVTLLIDSTWALHFSVLSAENGELETFATYLPYLSRSMFFTGVYPFKFSSKLDPLLERRLLSPMHPLYDVDPALNEVRSQVPLVITLLSIIDSLDDEACARRGISVTREDRVKVVMEYLRYPSNAWTDLLLRHRIGRKGLEAYRRFKENPVAFICRK